MATRPNRNLALAGAALLVLGLLAAGAGVVARNKGNEAVRQASFVPYQPSYGMNPALQEELNRLQATARSYDKAHGHNVAITGMVVLWCGVLASVIGVALLVINARRLASERSAAASGGQDEAA